MRDPRIKEPLRSGSLTPGDRDAIVVQDLAKTALLLLAHGESRSRPVSTRPGS